MNITITINDGQVAMTPLQATAAPAIAAADQSAGPNILLAGATAATPVPVHEEARNAGTPSASLIQEVESALGQLAETALVAADEGEINAGAAPV